MMELPKGFIPPEETVQALLEAPGIISQFDLRRLTELRDRICDGLATNVEVELFQALRGDLNERFEAGWLVEMGLVRIYRDHTGLVVIDDDPIRACEFN